jgi:hypothetical protein
VLNSNITSKILKYKEKKKGLQVVPKSMEHTIIQDKKKIKVNLSKLDEKTKHIRHNSFNFVFKKPSNNQNQSQGAITMSHRPEQQLEASIFDNNQPKGHKTTNVFDY